jgi:hypothetical protein
MDISQIRKYATKARSRFYDAISTKANSLGLTASRPKPSNRTVASLEASGFYSAEEIELVLKELRTLFSLHDFSDVLERTAYTWFNRLVALRYMEVHGFLSHQILVHAPDTELQNLRLLSKKVALFPHSGDRIQLKEMVSLGKSNEEIFRALLVSQCNELHVAMPFLFEEITLGLASLLPDNLLGKDSIIGNLVLAIPDPHWMEGVEIIGWLYQYYIAEKKKALTGKKLLSKDIPAATQLFTPRWIVRYLVQNTLGKKWLEHHKSPVLKSRWEYLMPEKASTSSKAGKKLAPPTNLNPESLTVLDPACGSGHILVEAYDTLKDMYLQFGFSPSEIAHKILKLNLYGLDIDERATQMASFALLMRARIDNPKILNGIDTPVPHIYSLESLDPEAVQEACDLLLKDDYSEIKKYKGKTRYGIPSCINNNEEFQTKISTEDFQRVSGYFTKASTLGSLTIIPKEETLFLLGAIHFLNSQISTGTPVQRKSALFLMQMVQRALLLASQYECVLANPPYLGSKFHPDELRIYLKENYSFYSRDVFSAFIVRNWQLTKQDGHLGFMSPFVWMFLTGYKKLREFLLQETTITSLIKLQYSAFDGATVPVCTFTLRKNHQNEYKGVYINLEEFKGKSSQSPKVIEAIKYPESGWLYYRSHRDFNALPDKSISFWLEDVIFETFLNNPRLGDQMPTRVGIQTSNNSRFLRRWFEVDIKNIAFDCSSREQAARTGLKWFPYNKGGKYRQWFGNHSFVINFQNDGQELYEFLSSFRNTTRASLGDPNFQFNECVTWSDVSSSHFGARYLPKGFLSDISGSGIFPNSEDLSAVSSYLCSGVGIKLIKAINPTLHFQTGNIASLPVPPGGFAPLRPQLNTIFEGAVEIMKRELTHCETNWTFERLPFLPKRRLNTLQEAINDYLEFRKSEKSALETLNFENNVVFAKSFGLPKPKEAETEGSASTYSLWNNTECVKRLISYGIGVILGRYRLDMSGVQNSPGTHPFSPKEGLITLSLKQPKDLSRDAYTLFTGFLAQTYGKKNLLRNLSFIASILDPMTGDDPESVIRTYLFKDFFSNHVKMYVKRPLYWEIHSGPRQAFKALMYCQVYTPFMLKTLRDKHLKPYIKASQPQTEAQDFSVAFTLKSKENNVAQQLKELYDFEEKLNLLISEKITLHLDDGIVFNFNKLGSILSNKPLTTLEEAA